KDLTLTVSNDGGAPLGGTASTSAPFSVVAGSAMSVAPGASQVLTVRFSPTSVGAASGTLALSTNDPARPNVGVALTGTGAAVALTTEVLSTDDGTVESGFTFDGAIAVNRLTPSRYPAALKTIRLLLTTYQGLPSPAGAQVRF